MSPRVVEVVFPVGPGSIPRDHGYVLYSALSRLVPIKERAWQLRPVGGFRDGHVLRLHAASALRVRVPIGEVMELAPLSGASIVAHGNEIAVGHANVHTLQSAPKLYSPFVTIQNDNRPYEDRAEFRGAVERAVAALAGTADVVVEVGERRVMRVVERVVAGYEVLLSGIPVGASVEIQSTGIGGRRRMGAGAFAPQGT